TARKKITLTRLRSMALKQKPITMLTAHDFPSGLRASKSGNDIVLVGDSLAQVALGYDSTTRLTLDEMLHHTRAVRRAVKTDGDASMVLADMPFGTYHTGINDAVSNAVKLVKEGGAEAVKLEGGEEVLEIVRTLTRIGIPIVGHIGLCPQRHTQSSGYRVQGKDAQAAFTLLRTAHQMRLAGAALLVLEAIPHPLASFITSFLTSPLPPSLLRSSPALSMPFPCPDHVEPLPTIGIGAGNGTSGQVLVQDDMLGFWIGHRPRFVRHFMPSYLSQPTDSSSPPHSASSIGDLALSSAKLYVSAVRTRDFPSVQHGEVYDMDSTEWAAFLSLARADEFFGLAAKDLIAANASKTIEGAKH
ncbi:ketopantoate hydroxymethyltransferase, partial [Clavulina sp. PMI_390]